MNTCNMQRQSEYTARVLRDLVSQLLQHLRGASQAITALTNANVENKLLNAETTHGVLSLSCGRLHTMHQSECVSFRIPLKDCQGKQGVPFAMKLSLADLGRRKEREQCGAVNRMSSTVLKVIRLSHVRLSVSKNKFLVGKNYRNHSNLSLFSTSQHRNSTKFF